jgi:hypothetical protein
MTTACASQPLKRHCFSKEIKMKAWIAAAAFAATWVASAAQASDVSWTITVGSPRPAPRVIYAPPPVIYQPPPVVYYPAPVVYHPTPVVAQPVYQQVVYAQPAQQVQHIPPGHLKKWRKHAYKHGYYDSYRDGYSHGRHHD